MNKYIKVLMSVEMGSTMMVIIYFKVLGENTF